MSQKQEPEPLSPAEMQRRADFKKIFFGDEAGFRVFGEMLEFSGLLKLSFTGNSYSYFNEGKRAFMAEVVDALGFNDDGAFGLTDIIRIVSASRQQYAKLEQKDEDDE